MVRDLYQAVAKTCGLEQQRPEAVLLIVEVYSLRVHQKFMDMAAPLTEIRDNDELLTYVYPSEAHGPLSGGKELHIFHRCLKHSAAANPR